MMNSAARSFTDWPGFMNSALPRMVQPVCTEARLSRIRGVLPIASTMPSRVCMPKNQTGGQGTGTLDDRSRPDKAAQVRAARDRCCGAGPGVGLRRPRPAIRRLAFDRPLLQPGRNRIVDPLEPHELEPV